LIIYLVSVFIHPTMGNTGRFAITTFVNSCINLLLSIIILSGLVYLFNNSFLKKFIGK
jgi:hypothetical protein